jgi:hypothetical protein
MTITPLPDLERLNRLYTAGFRDAFLDSALHKIVERQAARDEADLQRVTRHLREFEVQYGLTSDEFFQKYQAGQLADTVDFTEWSAYCKMHRRILQRQRILQSDVAHE